MGYLHPLGYLLGLEGIALMRAFCGDHDREFTLRRLDEIRALLDAAEELGDGGEVGDMSTRDGYRGWAPFYDEPGNALIDLEQPLVDAIVDALPIGVAVDAGCGTGRHALHLARLGHRVIGVDSSPDMLRRARTKVDGAAFHEAELHRLPLGDNVADLVVCALALVHVEAIEPVFAEFARVLRPGGHLVVSDQQSLLGDAGLPMVMRGANGVPAVMPNHNRRVGDYLRAALPLGLQVRACAEPPIERDFVDAKGIPPGADGPAPRHDPEDVPNIWALHPYAPEATNAAYRTKPAVLVLHFQLDA